MIQRFGEVEKGKEESLSLFPPSILLNMFYLLLSLEEAES